MPSQRYKMQASTSLLLKGSDYILLPDRNLYVAKQNMLLGRSWEQAKPDLENQGLFMLPLPEFPRFLRLLSSGQAVYDGAGKIIPQAEVDSIRNNIVQVGPAYRGRSLGARFSKQGDAMQITYHKLQADGTFMEVTEPLEDCLMEDKAPGILLEDWIANPTSQGLPRKKVKKGDLYYWHPSDGAFAWFIAGSVGAVLVCLRDPLISYSGVGVVVACAAGAKNFEK